MNNRHSAGFTLIELVIVIIILGVLSATALPKFINLKSDASAAALGALQGTLKSSNTLIYSLAAIQGVEQSESSTVSVNGTAINTVEGYIRATPTNIIAALAGDFSIITNANEEFEGDWGIYSIPGSGTQSQVYIVPNGFATFDNCSLRYLTESGINDPTFYSLTINGC